MTTSEVKPGETVVLVCETSADGGPMLYAALALTPAEAKELLELVRFLGVVDSAARLCRITLNAISVFDQRVVYGSKLNGYEAIDPNEWLRYVPKDDDALFMPEDAVAPVAWASVKLNETGLKWSASHEIHNVEAETGWMTWEELEKLAAGECPFADAEEAA